MRSTVQILLGLLVIAIGTILTLSLGRRTGFLALIALFAALFVAIDRMHRLRSRQLARSVTPGERVVANGLVSDSKWEETPAVLVQSDKSSYRLLVADRRKSLSVQGVFAPLVNSVNPKDPKMYIGVSTQNGVVHFAPRRGFFISGQESYAQEVLNQVLASGLHSEGAEQ